MTTPLAWGRRLTWSESLVGEMECLLIAPADDRRTIARDMDIETLEHLQALVSVRPWLDGIELEGRVQASLTRLCGLSLEPFEVAVDEPLFIRLVPLGSVNAPSQDSLEVVIDLDAEDPPDVAADGMLDICAYVVEALALSLDPFPRKPGAVFSPPEPTTSLSPFAVLAERAKREL